MAVVLWTTATAGHQGAVPLTFWGDNLNSVDARCQLEIGAGAASCGLRTWQIRRQCLLRRIAGGTCDEEADRAAIEAARLSVFQGAINPACQQANLNTLFFSDAQDVQFDVVTFCRELESAAVSAVFNPYFAAGDGELDPVEQECVRALATVATKAFEYSFRVRKGALDRIAYRRRPARVKNNDIADANRRIALANTALRDALVRRCSEDDFTSLYGLTTTQAIDLITSRSACLTDRTYPVVAFDCPLGVCGNGMREPNERCDDGNTASGDGCSAVCEVEL